MSVVSPQTLPNVDSSASDSNFIYKYRTTIGDFHIYSQYSVANGSLRSEGHDIKVGINASDTATYNIWADAGSLNPASFTVNNGIVYCYQSAGYLAYAFTKPTEATASWISSSGGGGGTSTEGVTTPTYTGSLTLVGSDLVYVIDSTSASTRYYLTKDGFYFGAPVTEHTQGTQSGGTISNAERGVYALKYEDTSYPFDQFTIATLRVGFTKSSCNFW